MVMKQPKSKSVATHLQDDDCHAVIVDSLRVLIIPDEGGWFAQGLEIDYAAGGDSVEDVKQRFQQGLESTIHEHLRVFGNIDNLLNKQAPSEEWELYAKNKKQFALSMATFRTQNQGLDEDLHWPYPEILYLEQRVA